MNKEIALIEPKVWAAMWFMGYPSMFFLVYADSIAIRVLGALCVFPLMSFAVLWPNFARAATLSKECELIKDKYFYLSIILFSIMTIFLITLIVGGSFEVNAETPLFLAGLIIFVIATFGTSGLVFKCWRIYAYDKDGDRADPTHAAWKLHFAYGYIPFAAPSIHRGLLRYRERQGWSNHVKIPRFEDDPSAYGAQSYPPHNNAGTVKYYGPRRR